MDRAGSSQEPSDAGGDAANLAQREQEATTKETLKDVEEKEKNRTASDESHDKSPSPDGAFDENRELKDADPV
jgi:hypothetical protein